MKRKPITEIIIEINNILKKDNKRKMPGLTTWKISLMVKSDWKTTRKALKTLKDLGVVKQRKNMKPERVERLYSLK